VSLITSLFAKLLPKHRQQKFCYISFDMFHSNVLVAFLFCFALCDVVQSTSNDCMSGADNDELIRKMRDMVAVEVAKMETKFKRNNKTSSIRVNIHKNGITQDEERINKDKEQADKDRGRAI